MTCWWRGPNGLPRTRPIQSLRARTRRNSRLGKARQAKPIPSRQIFNAKSQFDTRRFPTNKQGQISNVKFQISDVKCQMSNVKCQISNVKCRMSNVKCQCQISNFKCQISDVKCQMSNVKFQMSNVKCQISNSKQIPNFESIQLQTPIPIPKKRLNTTPTKKTHSTHTLTM